MTDPDWGRMHGIPPAAKGLHAVDYVIFGATLLVSIGIGLYHAFTGGKQRTTNEYFMANRKLQTLPVALSILVSFVSAILVLGTPAEMYTRGTELTVRTLGYCLAVALSSVLFVPLFYPLKITSSFEYLERRFRSKVVKLIGTVMMIIGNLFYMGLVIYTPSTALEAVTGFPLWASILACGIVATLYTTLGGMKAVIWTDVFQAFVMIAGMLAIVVQGTIKVGGLTKMWQTSEQGDRIQFFNFNPDPTQRLSFWSLTIGGMFSTLTIFGIGQSSVQRYCALPTLRQAKRSLFLNIPGLLIVNVLASLVGLVVYAYYAEAKCDPLKQKYISNSNQLVPYFVIDVLNYPGFPGVFLAVLFSGALSSVSSCLNSLSAVTWQDILKYFFVKLTESKKAFITKILVSIYGCLAIVVSFLTDGLGIHVLQASLSFTGATSGPCLGMFLLGAFFPFVGAAGAVSGCLVSLAFSLWLAIGTFLVRPYKRTTLPTSVTNCAANFTTLYRPSTLYGGIVNSSNVLDPYQPFVNSTLSPQTQAAAELTGLNRLYGISFLWYSAIGASLTIIVGVIVSLIINKISGINEADNVNPDLIIPVAQNLCCCLPERWRHKLSWRRHNMEKEEMEKGANGTLVLKSSSFDVENLPSLDLSPLNAGVASEKEPLRREQELETSLTVIDKDGQDVNNL